MGKIFSAAEVIFIVFLAEYSAAEAPGNCESRVHVYVLA